MTMPDERTRAVLQTRDFLKSLASSVETTGVPDSVRAKARRLLRHFPSALELTQIHHHLPGWFGPALARPPEDQT